MVVHYALYSWSFVTNIYLAWVYVFLDWAPPGFMRILVIVAWCLRAWIGSPRLLVER